MSDNEALLSVSGLHAGIEGKEILHGVDLVVKRGEIHALMGPNGSGKSTLAYALMGHPSYAVSSGSATFDGADLLTLAPEERATRGMFLSFQHPTAIPGVTTVNFLRAAMRAQGKELAARDFLKAVNGEMTELKMDETFRSRYINDGFSGGEKKRAEILQMAMLKPQLAILDEPDSGLDVDALRIVADGVKRAMAASENRMGVLLITHYNRVLEHLRPDVVHVFAGGRIITSGGPEMAHRIEAEGYETLLAEAGVTVEAAPV